MSFSVDLYRDSTPVGGITFCTVPTSDPFDYKCNSEGVLRYRHLELERNGDMIVVRLGRHRVLDELTVHKISDELLGVADQPDCHRLLLDFSGVVQVSSMMLAKLAILHRKMEPKGEKLRLFGVNLHLRSILTTTKLDRLFDITDTEAGAHKAVATQTLSFAEKTI